MDAGQLRTFVDVAQRRSFAAVAREQRVSPSSVSRTVAALEEEVGVPLFDRTTRRMSLTEAGEAYLRRVEPLVDDLEAAADDARGAVRGPKGILRVLAPVSFGQLNVAPLLTKFLGQHRGLRLELRLEDELPDLIEERIDLAIDLGPVADSGYVARRLTPLRSRVCASRSYLARHGIPVSPADLSGHACLVQDGPGLGERWRFRNSSGAETIVQVDGPLGASHAVALKASALAGGGVVCLGDWAVGRELAEGTLVDLFPRHEVTATSFEDAAWTLRPPRAHVPTKVAMFEEFLNEAFAEGPPWACAPA